jgi:redox-sensitive bicupin YhaK (pirin superfamily)
MEEKEDVGQHEQQEEKKELYEFISRATRKKVRCIDTVKGVNFRVRRVIGSKALKILDPFLLMDDIVVGPPAGYPEHPHRGLETVTYVLPLNLQPRWAIMQQNQGAGMGVEKTVWTEEDPAKNAGLAHEDCAGMKGVTGFGEVQWLTAGKGIMHAEMPGDDDRVRVLQLWISLASEHKLCEQMYQHGTPSEQEQKGVTARVIAGEALGIVSPFMTPTACNIVHFTLNPGSSINHPIPSEWSAVVYILAGQVAVSSAAVVNRSDKGHVVILEKGDGKDGVLLAAAAGADEPADVIFIAAKPHGESVKQYAAVAMNTDKQIQVR